MGRDELCGAILERDGGCVFRGHPLDEIIRGDIEQGAQDIQLVHEMAVEGAFANIGAFGDIFNGAPFNPFGIEDIKGGIQKPLPGLYCPSGSSAFKSLVWFVVHFGYRVVKSDGFPAFL